MFSLHCGDLNVAHEYVAKSNGGVAKNITHFIQGLETAVDCFEYHKELFPDMINKQNLEHSFTNHEIVFNALRVAIKNGFVKCDDVKVYFHTKEKTEIVYIFENGRVSCWPEGFFNGVDRSLDELLD